MSTKKTSKKPVTKVGIIAAAIRGAINQGELKPGDVVPGENTIMTEYKVSRWTAREALAQLVAEGAVTKTRGKGTYVREAKKLLRFGSSRYSKKLRDALEVSPFRAEALQQGKQASVECRSIKVIPSPDLVSTRVPLAQNAQVVRRENWYAIDDVIVQVGVTYIPMAIASGTPLEDQANTGPGSVYGRMEDQGHTVTWIREEITARMPTKKETDGMGIPAAIPVIDLIHTSIDQDGQPFEVTTFVMRSDLAGVDYKMPVDEEIPEWNQK